ncbi:sarcosine oxidase subunit delta [Rhodophyticola sp. CCM32]|uniref:sarcosine oxidase subunit delta n=1 Tax=Rhodophyticola sp. CCM32 TaxID=2916397 RepID=UPI00107EF48E|nr:sarcosine oxidase subunit delta [Rhodophyticola sp. CCM32]QBY00831.1 sarcosine oxidase subunit delta [Rhodophyticola sp. CCM32]
MRIKCPLCGDRDLREFTPKGHITHMQRPDADAGVEAWDDHLHLRDNPAGPTRELWFHTAGCAAWLVVDRNTVTHEITGVTLARDLAKAGAGHAD